MRKHLILATDCAATTAQAGVDPTLEDRDPQDTIRTAVAHRHGGLRWDVDHRGGVAHPEEHPFHDRALEETLAWCLWWLASVTGFGEHLVFSANDQDVSLVRVPRYAQVRDTLAQRNT